MKLLKKKIILKCKNVIHICFKFFSKLSGTDLAATRLHRLRDRQRFFEKNVILGRSKFQKRHSVESVGQSKIRQKIELRLF